LASAGDMGNLGQMHFIRGYVGRLILAACLAFGMAVSVALTGAFSEAWPAIAIGVIPLTISPNHLFRIIYAPLNATTNGEPSVARAG